MKIKQYHIDDGQVGGIINTIISSMWIFSIVNIFTFILVLKQYLKDNFQYDIPLVYFVVISILIIGFWAWINFAFFQKSMMKQIARQTCLGTDHPIMQGLEEIKELIKNDKKDN